MKTAIITGAYGAIGKAIAAGIAERPGFRVIIAGRDPELLRRAATELRSETGNPNITEGLVDLSLMKNINEFATRFNQPVHVLVNNASTTPRQRVETTDGVEMQWAVNVLAYCHLINAFTPQMSEAGSARIVNVASYWAGGLDLDDPEFKKRRYNNDTAYRQSKQAERMLTRAFSELLFARNIIVNACHPGDVNSKLSNNLGFGGSETPRQGADTPVWLAVSEEVEGITGGYFEGRRRQSCQFMKDTRGTERLMQLLAEYSSSRK